MKGKLLLFLSAGMNLVTLYFAITYIAADYLLDTSHGAEMQQSTQESGFWILATALLNLGMLLALFLSMRKAGASA